MSTVLHACSVQNGPLSREYAFGPQVEGKVLDRGARRAPRGLPPDLPERVARRIRVEPGRDACWVIGGGAHYASVVLTDEERAFWPDLRRSVVAHRLVLRLAQGEPYGWLEVVHHRCERPGCVRPSHLVALRPAEHAAEHRRLAALAATARPQPGL